MALTTPLRRLATGAALAALLTATACGGPPAAGGGGAQATGADICPTADTTGAVTIAMGQNLAVFAPMVLANATNAFADAGLDVSIEVVPTADARPLLAQGRLDAQMTSFTAANFNLADGGVEVKFVAPMDTQVESPPGTPVPGFWARRDVVGEAGALDLTKIRDGLVVGPTGTTGISAMILQGALEPFGMNLADVRTGETMTGPDGLVALSTGAVQLAWLTAPLEVEAAKNPDLVPVAGYPAGVTGTTLVAGPSLLDRPQVMVKVLQVLSDVTEEYLAGDYRQNPETVRLLAEAGRVDPSVITSATPLTFDPTFSMEGVAPFLTELETFLRERGELEYDEPVDQAKVLDTRFVEALATCGRAS